jgi:diguanylate cyclase (GGDEF)-like protein/PAS domain S-box-containing protein
MKKVSETDKQHGGKEQETYEYKDITINNREAVKCDVFLNVEENTLFNHGCDIEKGIGPNSCLYKILLDYSSDPIYCLNKEGKYIYANNAFSIPYHSEDIIGKKIWDVYLGQEGTEKFAIIKSVFESREIKIIEEKVKKNNSVCYFVTSINPIKDSRGKVLLVMCISRDITDRKLAEQALMEREHLLRESQKAAHIGSYEYDYKTKTWKCSTELDLILGIDEKYPHTDKGLLDIIHPDFRSKLSAHLEKSEREKSKFNYEYKIIRISDLKERWVQILGKLEYDGYGKVTRMFGTVQDITDRKRVEKEIIFLSYHDKLTGLYNRRFYEEEIKRLDTENNLPISIVMGDVNGLKLVNDAFGHAKGDELLLKCVNAIRKACRKDEIIARLGGDEFLILLPKTTREEAEEIVKRIKEHYSTDNVNGLSISISFGSDTKTKQDEYIKKIKKNDEDYMYNIKIIEKESMRGKIIKSLVDTFFQNNKREEIHARRVSEISSNIGKVLGFSEKAIQQLVMTGMLHDIGKIALEGSILDKQGDLTAQEEDELKRHPDIGYRILSSSYDMLDLADYVYAHHEKWDGSGYPKGLTGEKIPLISRIISIAESYDVLTNSNSYKQCMSKQEAKIELQRKAGSDFDPELVNIFLEQVL